MADVTKQTASAHLARLAEAKLIAPERQGRHHLAGLVGARLLDRLYALGWARRRKGTRIVDFSGQGERDFRKAFSLGA